MPEPTQPSDHEGKGAESPSTPHRPRVLVAEDEATLRMVISVVLEDEGYPVTAVESGERALEEFRREPFPIVVTDILMGRMTGLELLEAVRVIDSDTLVIVMTSHASVEAATEALRSGAHDFLVKPFDSLDVITAVVNRAAEKAERTKQNREITEELKNKATHLNRANSALIRLADSLKESANRDGLTGLFNHRHFREALIRALSRSEKSGRPTSIVFLDVDHFKQFNDTYGHLVGDDVLKTVAGLAQSKIEGPGIAARYGGDEMVVLLPGVSKADAHELAESIRASVESLSFPGRDGCPLGKITLSLGVATYPEDGEAPDALIARADRAVYEAKEKGRNTISG